MKKYNTSLKLLLDDQPDVNEGFSRLRRVNFLAQKGAKCELDFPDEYRQIFMKKNNSFRILSKMIIL